MPTVSALALSAGSLSTFCTSADNLSITAGGVPRGATRPFHTARSPRSTPVATNSDGSFGNGANARPSSLASARRLPAWTSDSSAAVPSNTKSAAPVSTPCATLARPLNEISTVLRPNFSLNRTQVSLVVIVPAPQLSLPGANLALATRSFAVLYGLDALTTSQPMLLAASETGTKSLSGS